MKLRSCGMLLAFGLAVLARAGAAHSADDQATAQTEEVLLKLHHSNQMEVAAGKLAQQKGQSKDVKSFGKMLVSDHSAADKKVTALAREEKIKLPTSPPMSDDKMDKMKAAKGADFDRMFAADMLEDHKAAIDEVKAARDNAKDEKLKALLVATLPVLEKHRDTAERLIDKLGPSASASGSDVTPTDTK